MTATRRLLNSSARVRHYFINIVWLMESTSAVAFATAPRCLRRTQCDTCETPCENRGSQSRRWLRESFASAEKFSLGDRLECNFLNAWLINMYAHMWNLNVLKKKSRYSAHIAAVCHSCLSCSESLRITLLRFNIDLLPLPDTRNSASLSKRGR